MQSYLKKIEVICRVLWLLLSVCLGVFCATYIAPYFSYILFSHNPEIAGIEKNFTLLILGLPTFFLLWIFRTLDTKESLNSNSFFGALNLIAGDKNQKRYGLITLIDLKKKNVYKDKINSILQNMDVVGANFSKLNLSNSDLSGVNFQESDLRGSKLQEADLQRANLVYADLQEANLQDADLQGVNLDYANLQDADLQGVNLDYANLQGANLQGANLQRAYLRGSNLQGVKLDISSLQGADLNGANYDSKTILPFSDEVAKQEGMKKAIDKIINS